MAKARKRRLKVYRTPIGFHDAYVAAPSQKAALEAWGADTNLFARGSAEEVTDPELMEAPLEHPGEVIKVSRGSAAEQIKALGKDSGRRTPSPRSSRKTATSRPLPRGERVKRRGPKPSRAKLTKAEEALETLRKRQVKAVDKLDKQEEALRRRRDELESKQAEQVEKAEARIGTEREAYQRKLRMWEETE